MFKQLVFSISIFLLAILALQCSDAAEKKTGRDAKALEQFERVKEAWAPMEVAYHKRGEVYSGFLKAALPSDPALFPVIIDAMNETLRETDSTSIIKNGKEITEINVKRFLQSHKTAASSFSQWIMQTKARVDQSLLTDLQSSLEKAELDILEAKKKYKIAAEAYNMAESDRKKHLPPDPFKYSTH
jgi:hypothetical protein